jgi:hypothetical protein
MQLRWAKSAFRRVVRERDAGVGEHAERVDLVVAEADRQVVGVTLVRFSSAGVTPMRTRGAGRT